MCASVGEPSVNYSENCAQEDERGPRMYAAKNAGSAAAFRAQESMAGLQSMPLAERAAAASDTGRRKASR